MKQKALVLFTFATILLLSLVKLGQHPLFAWDESRNCINAIEMLRNGDWYNLHYAGQPDTWNTKPPLFIWCVAASLKMLGFNEFALRLPSALSIIAAFFILFKIITLYRSATFAALTCLMLASVKGLIGWHVGRTGDFDSLLVFILLASVYYFLRFVDFDKKWAALCCGLCLGLAFLVKGPAAGVLLPGMLAYLIFTKKTKSLLASKTAWLGAATAIAFPVGWFWVQQAFGNTLTGSPTLSEAPTGTAFERLFSVDLWYRFTRPMAGWKEAFDFSYLFSSLDKTFNLWHYIFFCLVAYGIFLFFKNWRQTMTRLFAKRNHLLLLSLCLYLPLAVFLAIAAKSTRYYLAPALPFVGIATFWGIRHFWNKTVWVKWAFAGLLAFTLGRQFLLFWQVPPRSELVTRFAPVFAQAETIVVASPLEQDLLCYLYFFGKKMRFTAPTTVVSSSEVLVVSKDFLPNQLPPGIEIVAEDELYAVLNKR